MRFLFVLLAAVVSVGMMFLIAKLVGYRQISELSMYDYINSITLGSIAADLAISENLEIALDCLIGMVVYGAFTLFFSYVSMKSKKARNFIIGQPIILMDKGNIFKNSFKKANLDLDEFLSMCRASGYFDPSKLDTVLLEPSGKISIIPKAAERPLTPNDMKLPVTRDAICPNIIMDGRICLSNLKQCGYDEAWLKKQIKALGKNRVDDIFLATVDPQGQLHIFEDKIKGKANPL